MNQLNNKSYADTCLERAEKATPGPWVPNIWTGPLEGSKGMVVTIMAHGPLHKFKDDNSSAMNDAEFIAHTRTDVPELARRLQRACFVIREQEHAERDCTSMANFWGNLADDLEAMPEEK